MSFKHANQDTHQACRSLLQKAVRRGAVNLVRNTIEHLVDVGDKAWLRQRCVVIMAEECWPILIRFEYAADISKITDQLIAVTRSVKNKNAAGLGSLSYAFSEGDRTALKSLVDDRPVRIVASGLGRPEEYWRWLVNSCATEEQVILIQKLQDLYKKCGWPWDKAFVFAAGYLFINDPKAVVENTSMRDDEPFPFWVALDRHTPEGKKAIAEVAAQMSIPAVRLGWVSFYCESAVTDQSCEADWFIRERDWRLAKEGLDYPAALHLWRRAAPLFEDYLQNEVLILREHVSPNENFTQLTLL